MFTTLYELVYGKNGYHIEVNSNGILTEEGNYVNGQKDGNWRFYYDTGELRCSVDFKNGKLDGYYLEFKKNGIEVTGEYKNDLKTGTWTKTYPDGKDKCEVSCAFVNGVVHGEHIQIDDKGRIILKSCYVDGKKAGISKVYTYDDVKKTYTAIDICYKKVVKEVRYTSSDSLISRIEWDDYENFPNEYRETYYRGNIYKESQISYSGRKANGVAESWFKNGQKRSWGIYLSGKKDWVHTEWYSNGQKKRTRKYRDGKVFRGELGWNKDWNRDGAEKKRRTRLAKPMKSVNRK